MAKKPISTGGLNETGTASDSVEAEVIKGPGVPDVQELPLGHPMHPDAAPALQGDAEPEPEGEGVLDTTQGGPLGFPVNMVTDVEHAAQVLKAKASMLHTLVHNMGHYKTLAFNDVEQLMADMRWLVAFVRSKV